MTITGPGRSDSSKRGWGKGGQHSGGKCPVMDVKQTQGVHLTQTRFQLGCLAVLVGYALSARVLCGRKHSCCVFGRSD